MARSRKADDALSFQDSDSESDVSSDGFDATSDDFELISGSLSTPSKAYEAGNDGIEQGLPVSQGDLTDVKAICGSLQGLKWMLGVIRYLGLPSLSGYTSEGEIYQQLEGLYDCYRSGEFAVADGGINLSVRALPTSTRMSFAEKLSALKTKDQKFALEDSKRISISMLSSRIKKNQHRLWAGQTLSIRLVMSPKQMKHLSHLHVRFAAAPEMVTVLPKPGRRSSVIQDPLMHHMPVHPHYAGTAFPLSMMSEAQKNMKAMYLGEASSFVVPGSGVKAPAWKAKRRPGKYLQPGDTAAARAFDFFYDTIRSSPYAQHHSIRLDFMPYQPLGGDAQILQNNHEPQTLEFKYGVASEITEEEIKYLRLRQKGDTPEKRSKASAFSPFRTWNLLCLIHRKEDYIYCIPAGEVLEGWWSSESEIKIPLNSVAKFKVFCRDEWFEHMHKGIIKPHMQSQRPVYPVELGKISKDYAASKVEGEDEFQQARLWKSKQVYPWWKIEHWNDWCAWKGYGLFLPCGSDEEVANVVFTAWRWTKAQQVEYLSTRTLPAHLHYGDLGNYTPLLLIRAVNARTLWPLYYSQKFTQPGILSHISGLQTEGPLPCLLYVNTGSPEKPKEKQSGMLIPSEFIDYAKLHKEWEKEFQEEVTTARAQVSKEKAAAKERVDSVYDRLIYATNLHQCLTVPFTDFHVRDGFDFFDAVCSFSASHKDDQKPVTWSSLSNLLAKEDYVVSSQTFFQMLADRWIPATASKHGSYGRWTTKRASDIDEAATAEGQEDDDATTDDDPGNSTSEGDDSEDCTSEDDGKDTVFGGS